MTLDISPTFTWNETVWNPSMLGPALWLDAADASTITLNGSTVSQWSDKSGNKRHAVQNNTSLQPTYSLASLNGKNTITFSAAETDQLLIAGFNLDAAPFTIFEVGDGGMRSGSSSFYPRFYFTPNAISYIDLHIASWPEDLTERIISWSFDGINQHIVHRNAASVGSATQAVTSGFLPDYYIGRNGSDYSDHSFAEYIIYTSYLNQDSRQKVEGYLAHKWGLEANLPADHPYKNYGPRP